MSIKANRSLPVRVQGFDYFKPHSFWKTLAQLGERRCPTPETFKAWSRNLGHQRVMTTFTGYGAVAASRHKDIMHRFACSASGTKKALDLVRTIETLNNVVKNTGRTAGQPQTGRSR